MKKLLALGLVVLFASTANAANFWMEDLATGSMDGYTVAGGNELTPSDVASIGIYLQISALDVAVKTDAAIAGIWLDNVVVSGDPVNYEVTNLVYHADVINGVGNPGWNRVDRDAIPNWDPILGDLSAPIQPDQYTGSYGYDPLLPNGAPFATADTPALLDELVIHCTGESLDYLYFENPTTTAVNARVPALFNSLNSGYVYALQNDFPGAIVMLNAWAEGAIGFDVPFIIEQVPEPATLALLAFGGLALIRRR